MQRVERKNRAQFDIHLAGTEVLFIGRVASILAMNGAHGGDVCHGSDWSRATNWLHGDTDGYHRRKWYRKVFGRCI